MTSPRRQPVPPISGADKGALRSRASLRPFSDADATEILDALQDCEMVRWLAALPVPVDPESGNTYLRFLLDPDVHAYTLRVDRTFAGLVSLGTELTFWIRAEMQGNGLGRWAVRRFLEQLPADITTVTACCMQENAAAANLLIRLGFSQVRPPFKRFSFAHEHAVPFLRFTLARSTTSTGFS